MKKSELKYGYMVEFRNGERALYMPTYSGDIFDCCDYEDMFQPLCEYDEHLKHCNSEKDDVVIVFGYSHESKTTCLRDRRIILWEETQSYPILTPDEKMNLEGLLRNGYKYIFQQQGCVGKDSNYKNHKWFSGMYFDFLTYWDKEYWNIQELLDNCEVDEMCAADRYFLELSNFINK